MSSSLQAMKTPCITLHRGTRIPCIGFGTGTQWFLRNEERNSMTRPLNENTVDGVRRALKVGWRHIDAAEMYGSEREVGKALKEHLDTQAEGRKAAREQLFVTSKLFHSLKQGISAKDATQSAMHRLCLDYLDLLLIHAPFLPENVKIDKVWREMEGLVDDGIVRDIGVSNFRISDLDSLLGYARIKPAINQVEANPYLQQAELKGFCDKNGIVVEAFSPLAPITAKPGGPLDPVLSDIAATHKVTTAQLLLRWSLQKGYLPITTTKNEQRLHEFLDAAARSPSEAADGPTGPGSFALTPAEVDRISEVGSQLTVRQFWQKEFGAAN